MDYTNYAGLAEAITNELDRTDITPEHVASFIRIAERRCFRSLRIPAMEVKVVLPILPPEETEDDGVAYLEPPEDWLETISLTDNAGRRVEFVSQQHFRSLLPAAAGRIRYFTREANRFLLWPATGIEEVVLYYYREPEPIDPVENPSPAIYDLVGDAIFFGAVSEGWRFIREPERSLYYRELFGEMLEQLQEKHRVSDRSGSSLVSKNPYL